MLLSTVCHQLLYVWEFGETAVNSLPCIERYHTIESFVLPKQLRSLVFYVHTLTGRDCLLLTFICEHTACLAPPCVHTTWECHVTCVHTTWECHVTCVHDLSMSCDVYIQPENVMWLVYIWPVNVMWLLYIWLVKFMWLVYMTCECHVTCVHMTSHPSLPLPSDETDN